MSTPISNPARFGSEAWLEQQLLHVLQAARNAVDAEYKSVLSKHHISADYDHYVFLRISRRQRKIRALLHRLGEFHPWVRASMNSDTLGIEPPLQINDVFVKNAEAPAARAAADVLMRAGIEAKVVQSWQ